MSYLDGCIELTKEELRLVNGGTSDFKIESSLSDNGHEMGNGYMQYKAQIDRTNAEIDANRASGTGTGSGSGSGTGGGSGSGSGSNSGSGNSGNSTGTDTSAAGNNSSSGTGTGSEPSFYGYNPNMIEPSFTDLYELYEERTEALSHEEQKNMALKHLQQLLNEKKTEVWIVRNTDGLDNRFNSTRYIYKDGQLVYQDVVGANAFREDWSKLNADSTTPDGIYYLSNKPKTLKEQTDGSYNSNSYVNVLSLLTNDMNISKKDRNAVNCGDRYFHANQKKDKDEVYSTTKPYGLGCIIGCGGQDHQNEMMGYLMDGVSFPEQIRVNIVSLNNKEIFGDIFTK